MLFLLVVVVFGVGVVKCGRLEVNGVLGGRVWVCM